MFIPRAYDSMSFRPGPELLSADQQPRVHLCCPWSRTLCVFLARHPTGSCTGRCRCRNQLCFREHLGLVPELDSLHAVISCPCFVSVSHHIARSNGTSKQQGAVDTFNMSFGSLKGLNSEARSTAPRDTPRRMVKRTILISHPDDTSAMRVPLKLLCTS